MLTKLVIVALGGAAGSVLRYLLSGYAQSLGQRLSWPGAMFPWGTLAVNLIGSLLVGVLAELAARAILPPGMRLLLVVGLLGGFTTLSAMSLETADLLAGREWWLAALNLAATAVLGVLLALAGSAAVRAMLSALKGAGAS